jgi:DNA-binding NarL/FixJ family response regulator
MVFDQLDEPLALVIEDHEALRHALCEWIGKAFGRCQVREFKCVEDALPVLDAEKVDVVLMDLKLPGMNGIDGTRTVLEHSPQTSVVMVSNYDDATHRAAAARAGAHAFVAKRAIRNELSPVLRTLLVHAAFQKNPQLTDWVNA